MSSAASSPPRRIAVIVLTWQSEKDVDRCFSTLASADFTGLDVDLIAVDNASTDGTTTRIRDGFPHVRLIENGENLGFAGGINVGIHDALQRGAEFVYLLNPDTEVERAFLQEALAVARSTGAAAVQSLLLLATEPDHVNSAGNSIHFLGFGYCGGYRRHRTEIGAEPREIAFASGACALYRVDVLREIGFLDERLFLYDEDMDLGWRLRLAGHRAVIAPRSHVWHRYEFSRTGRKFYFLERNRYWVLLKNLRARNLALLAPFLLGAEVGVVAAAVSGGWLSHKVRAVRDAFRPAALRSVLAERRRVQRLRKVPDRTVLRAFTGIVDFEGAAPGPMQSLANAVSSALWRVLRPMLR